MEKYRADYEGYAVSSKIKKIFLEEGYVALRIVSEDSEDIKVCEALKIKKGYLLPQGADTIIASKMLSDYGSLVLIEDDFEPQEGLTKE